MLYRLYWCSIHIIINWRLLTIDRRVLFSEETNNNPGGQNEPPKSRMDLNNVAKRKLRVGIKRPASSSRSGMVVLGVLLFIKPVYSAIGLAYIVTIGFIVYGVYEIIAYFRTPAD